MNSFTLRFIHLLYDFELFFSYSVRLFIGEYEVKSEFNTCNMMLLGVILIITIYLVYIENVISCLKNRGKVWAEIS